MIVNRLSVKKRAAVFVLVVLATLAGIVSYMELPRESTPDITVPYIFVTTTYTGASPADMEKLVTIPLEKELKAINGIKEMTSVSDDSVSLVTLEFHTDMDIDEVLAKVKDKVDEALPDLPDDLDADPVVKERNLSDVPIMSIAVTGDMPLDMLKDVADDMTEDIEALPGVLEAVVTGGSDREIQVVADLRKLNWYGLTLSDVRSALTGYNVNSPAGSLTLGDTRWSIRVPADFKSPSDISTLVIGRKDGVPVMLPDVAVVRDGFEDRTTSSMTDGKPSVSIDVKRRSGANVPDISDSVRSMLEGYEVPRGISVTVISDDAIRIRSMVEDLENNILTSLVLVLVVVLAFIGGRSALFVSLSIPLSMLVTFAVLDMLGVTLNMVVLFSLVLALGMLVDNGIVVVENVYRHMQMGKTRMRAAIDGVDEVAWPVTASTATTVGAFFPMLFWPGIMGEFMGFLPLTVTIGLLASLFVALVVNPAVSSLWQSAKPEKADARPGLLERGYGKTVTLATDFPAVVIVLSVLAVFASGFAFARFGKGVEFFTDTDPARASIKVELPVGASLAATTRRLDALAAMVPNHRDIDHVTILAGENGAGGGEHKGEIVVDYKKFSDRTTSSQSLFEEMADNVARSGIVGARVEKRKNGPPSGAAVNLEISGPDMDTLTSLAREREKILAGIPGAVSVTTDVQDGKPELSVHVDRVRSAMASISSAEAALAVRTAGRGVVAGTYRDGKDDIDIVLKLPAGQKDSIEDLTAMNIPGVSGDPVPITEIAKVVPGTGFGAITRIDGRRTVTVSGETMGRLAGEVIADFGKAMPGLPAGYSARFTGEQESQAEAADFLGKAFVAAILIIFLVLSAQFDGFAAPVVILFSVVLSLSGVFLGLLVMGKPFCVVMTGIGVISLAGVVVNNSIVLLDCYRERRREGLDPVPAIVQAGTTRLRPVLLTAITTILGLLPMALGISFDFHAMALDLNTESSQWWGSMASAVVFGLGVATILTLVVVPSMVRACEKLFGDDLFTADQDG